MAARLPSNSTQAKQPAPPAAPASLPCDPAAAAPPAQQQPTIQLRTIRPPKTPQTMGSAECGWVLPTTGTATPVPVFGNGASGTLFGMGRSCCLRSEACAPSARLARRRMQADLADISPLDFKGSKQNSNWNKNFAHWRK